MTFLPSERPFFEDLARQLNARAAPAVSAFESLVLLMSEPFFSAQRPAIGFDDEGHVTAIDLSGFPFYSCALVGPLRVDASRLVRLESLRLFGVALELDVAHNAALRSLNVDGCNLESLRLPPRLEHLSCSATPLETLDLSSSPKLRSLKCVSTQLEALDVSTLLELEILECGWNDNGHYREGASGPRLKTLTLGALPVLRELDLQNWLFPGTPTGVRVESLDLSRLPRLERLSVNHCALRTLDLSRNPELRGVWCDHNPLEALDVRRNTRLERLSLAGTEVRHVDVSGLTAFQSLSCGGPQLETVQLGGTRLEYFACEKAPHVELDLSGQPLLRTLTLVKCGVKAIDVSASVALRDVTITSCPKLREVKCTEKQKSTIAGLRKFFKLAKPVTDPAKMDAIALQAFVEHYNWDDGMPRLLKAVRNPHCSLATALTIYWRASPHWVLQYANDAAIPAVEREVVPLMREIERRALEGAYRHHPDIEWISGDVMRDPDPKLEKKRELPPHMVALTRVDSPARQ